MAESLLKIVADFDVQLASAPSAGDTTATLTSYTDDDGNTLPTGTYGLTIDGGNSSKEYIVCTLNGVNLTNIYSITRQGIATAGFSVKHRRGAKVAITDWAILSRVLNNIDSTTGFNSLIPIRYDAHPSFTPGSFQIPDVKYVDDIAIAGSPKATDSTFGISKLSTAAVDALIPIVVGDNDTRVPTQNENNALVGNNTDIAVGTGNKFVTQTGLQHSAENYAACASASSTSYTATLSPVPTSYTAGMPLNIKIDVTNTTTTPTLNVNGLGAHTIKNLDGSALAPGQLYAGGIFPFIHDGSTTWQLVGYAPSPSTIFAQDISNFGTGTPSYTSFACGTGGISTTEPLFVMVDTNSGSPVIIRYIKTDNGSLMATHSVVFSASSSAATGAKIVVMGNYVYGVGYNGSATLVRRWDKADLTNVTTITVSGTAFGLGVGLFSDGTDIYQCYSAGLAKKYTLSGTTLTSSSDTAYTSMVTTDGVWCDGTSVYQLSSGLTGYKWALAGGARTTGTALVSTTQLIQSGTLVQGSAIIKEAGNGNYMYAMGLNNSTVIQVGRVIPITIF